MSLFGWVRSQRKSSSERLPWYRAPDYSGNFTEAEKRALDAFRVQALETLHPAHQYNDLPAHVEAYIARLEIEMGELKQERTTMRALATALFGAVILYCTHFGVRPSDSIWGYFIGLAFITLPWIVYRSDLRKNADEFAPGNENILKEWELDYITAARVAARRRANDNPPPI